MHNPIEPGEMLRGWFSDLNIRVIDFAAHLGISRVMLSRVLTGHAVVYADMDLRLSEALGTLPGQSFSLQTQRDLWAAEKNVKERQQIKLLAGIQDVASRESQR